MEELAHHSLMDKVNIILLSDHGMAEVLSTNAIILNQFVDPSWYSSPQLSAVGFIYPLPGKSTYLTLPLRIFTVYRNSLYIQKIFKKI